MSFLPSTRKAVNKVVTVPAPTGGLNARDSLANMPETDALVLNNWWPQPYGLQPRLGYREWVTGLPGTVGTLATWASADGTDKLFAVAGSGSNGGLYDVSDPMSDGDPAPTPLITGLANNTWQTIQTVNAAGTHLIMVNGSDEAIVYDAAGIHRVDYEAVPPAPTPPFAPYTWYGLDSTTVVQITEHQGRLWATVNNSARGYFMKEPDAVYGEWDGFDFGALFTKGGYISFMTTWTIDDGNGAEDHLVVVSSEGQAAVYGGTDPQDDTKWNLVGLYYIGEPVIGRRGFYKLGGDLIILTQRGLISMASQLVSTKVNGGVNAVNSDKVQILISNAVSSLRTMYGWELYTNPSRNLFLINVPSIVAGGSTQMAANVVTDKCPWTVFNGMDAYTWETFKNDPFFGDRSGRVLRAWDGWVDNVPLSGVGGKGVATQVQQAYSYLGSLATQKQVGMYRPSFLVSTALSYRSIVEYDFVIRQLNTPSAAPYSGDSALWDTALWDQGQWSGGLRAERPWTMSEGIGVAASLRIAAQSQTELVWVATDYSYKVGTLL